MSNDSKGGDFFRTVLLTVLVLLFAGFISPGGVVCSSKAKQAEALTITCSDTPALTATSSVAAPESLLSAVTRQLPDALSVKFCLRNVERLQQLRYANLQHADFMTGPAPLHFYFHQYRRLYSDPDTSSDLG